MRHRLKQLQERKNIGVFDWNVQHDSGGKLEAIEDVVKQLKEKERLHKMLFLFQETDASPDGDFFASLQDSHEIWTCGFVSVCVPRDLAIGAKVVREFQQQKEKEMKNNGRGFLAVLIPELDCVVCSVHFPHPKAGDPKYEEMRKKVEECTASAQKEGHRVIVGGDFNSKRHTEVGLPERVKSGDTRNKFKWRRYTPMQPTDVPCDRLAYSSGMTMQEKSDAFCHVKSSDHFICYAEWNFSKDSLQQQNERLNLECASQKTALEIVKKQISTVNDEAHVLSLFFELESGEAELKRYGELIHDNDHLIAHLSCSR